MSSKNDVHLKKFSSNGIQFELGSYNGISVIKNTLDGFINVTKMCKQFNRKFKKINENQAWQAYFNEFKLECSIGPELGQCKYELKSKV